jgi:hypothetical protein
VLAGGVSAKISYGLGLRMAGIRDFGGKIIGR